MGKVIGIDLGDRKSHYCVLNEDGIVIEEGTVQTTPAAFSSDRVDACALARLVRVDPQLLAPVQHRSEEDQNTLAILRARDLMVRTRARLVNCVRGMVKSTGARLPACSATSFAGYARQAIPAELRLALDPLLEQIQSITNLIKRYNRKIATIAATKYPATQTLQQIRGVGAVTALGFILTLGNSERFMRSRDAGAYLGLRPRRYQSGESNPQLGISKEGDGFMRRYLVTAAQYILGPFGPDTDLRRWGESLIARGGKGAKNRAVVAVARKLSVLLHHLWVTGEVYEPLRNSKNKQHIEQMASA